MYKKSNPELFKLGESISCKYHGMHRNWRFINKEKTRLKCKICDKEQKSKTSYLKKLLGWARNRKIEFNISENDIESLIIKQNNKCALTGVLFDDNNKPSIDRIDSSKGYMLDNIQLTLFIANRIKCDINESRLFYLCKCIKSYKQLKKENKDAIA